MPNLSDPKSNVTDETKAKFFAKALKSKQAHEASLVETQALLGAHRAVLKDAKKAGVSAKAISRVLAERNEDPDVIQYEEREYLKMKAVSGAPLKFQDDLLGGPTLDLSDEDKAAIPVEKAYDDGVFAGAAGHNRDINKHAPGTEENAAFDRGWIIGQKRIAAGMGPKKEAVRTPRKGRGAAQETAGAAH